MPNKQSNYKLHRLLISCGHTRGLFLQRNSAGTKKFAFSNGCLKKTETDVCACSFASELWPHAVVRLRYHQQGERSGIQGVPNVYACKR